MIPASQIIRRVRIRHESMSSIRWADSDILDIINEGLDDLSEATRFYERHVSIPLIDSQTYYDLRGFLPETALGVTSVWNTMIQDWLVPASIKEMGSRWEQSAGPPLRFFIRGLYWMAVWPKPATTTGTLRVYFPAYAPHYTHSQAVLKDLFDEYETALEDYALYDMAAQDGESDRALALWVAYTNRIGDLGKHIQRRIRTARTLRMGSR